jgi:signal transduction histidine kinase
VINAVEAMPAGGTLSVAVKPLDDGFVSLTVADTGLGIAPEIVDHIFEPFFSTKKQGTGLGLSISHNIVQEHGGDILVRSEVGEGTVFDVRLPVCEEREL